MKNLKSYPSVVDMVRAHSKDEPAFVREFEDRLHGRRLVTLLSVLRCRAGLSQRDLAARMGCTQSKISKLESGKDADVSIGDLLRYTAAAENEIRLFFVPKRRSILHQVELHAQSIGTLLSRLVELVGDDPRMGTAVKIAVNKVNFDLGKIVQRAIDSLPAATEAEPQPFQVEAAELEERITDSTDDGAAKARPQAGTR